VLIAATAETHRLVVVTRNERHFGRIERLAVENWWR
jgi:predicted nucleic acid-binding protein